MLRKILRGGVVAVISCAAMSAGTVSAVTVISNNFLRVSVATQGGEFRIESRDGSADGAFVKGGGKVVTEAVTDAKWGSGTEIEVTHPSGDIDRITLFEKQPFVFLQTVLKNSTAEVQQYKFVKTVELMPTIAGVSGSKLVANGTCGLVKPAAAEVGSYCYLAVADPASRRGMVSGWLTSNRGSGAVFIRQQDGNPVVREQLDYGALRIAPGAEEPLETLLIGFFDDARIGLEKYADNIARQYEIHMKPQPSVYCSWYHLWRGVTDKAFLSNVDAAKKLLAPYGLSVMQIDDGWQEGFKARGTPKKVFLEANKQFPKGMKIVADKVCAQNLVAGIWYMPFSGDADDPWFKDKQELFARTADGKIYSAKWGGNPFDLTKAAARDYVRKVAKTICRDWGYKYIKIDGLWTGTATSQRYINTRYVEDNIGETKLADKNITHIQAYRLGLKEVRKGSGDDVYILGCNGPQNMRSFSGAFGLVDGMRVGPDNGSGYPGVLRGPVFGGRFYFLHNRVWQNDPDPVYVRRQVPLNEARMLCSWVTVAGQLCSSSELYSKLPPKRLELLRSCLPSHNLKPRPADYFTNPCPAVWLLQDKRSDSSRIVVGCFNWGKPDAGALRAAGSKDPAEFQKKRKKKWPGDVVVTPLPEKQSYDMGWIGLDAEKQYIGYEYWTGKFIAPFNGKLNIDVPPRDARVLSLKPALAGTAQVLSTSRHITQGIVDLEKETWDAGTKTLNGTSRVVAGDVYELRIAAGLPGASLKCIAADLSKADAATGVKISIVSQDGWKLRVRIDAPESREVNWSLKFK